MVESHLETEDNCFPSSVSLFSCLPGFVSWLISKLGPLSLLTQIFEWLHVVTIDLASFVQQFSRSGFAILHNSNHNRINSSCYCPCKTSPLHRSKDVWGILVFTLSRTKRGTCLSFPLFSKLPLVRSAPFWLFQFFCFFAVFVFFGCFFGFCLCFIIILLQVLPFVHFDYSAAASFAC